MAVVFGKLKCYFCDKTDGVLQSVHEYGHYGEVGKRKFYHDECLQMIEISPEKYGHNMVDKALHIHDLKSQNEKANKTIIDDFMKKIETLNMKNFERLMPKP